MAQRAPLTCTVRASDIILAEHRPEGISARNVLAGVVREISDLGERCVLTIESGPLWLVEISRASLQEMMLVTGKSVHMIVKATAVAFH
jgi:molybdate transport system ATP-binding protein